MTTESPLVKVARDLREIETLHEALIAQAIQKASDRLMPGGPAMVALAPVASPDDWSETLAAVEFRHLATCDKLDHTRCQYAQHVEDEDGVETPLQTLLFWSEAWRARFGYELGRRPTMRTEANFLRGCLEWAWDNEPAWDDFRKDIGDARTRIENLLLAGVRAERGAPCMYDECRGSRLVRKLEPFRNEQGEKGWRHSNWHCPKCHRQWDEDAYSRHVTAAHERTKFEVIYGETWCSVEYAARHIGRPQGTVRAWLSRGRLSTACMIAGRRLKFVPLAEVEEIHRGSQERKRA